MMRHFCQINYIGNAVHCAPDTPLPQIFATPLG